MQIEVCKGIKGSYVHYGIKVSTLHIAINYPLKHESIILL